MTIVYLLLGLSALCNVLFFVLLWKAFSLLWQRQILEKAEDLPEYMEQTRTMVKNTEPSKYTDNETIVQTLDDSNVWDLNKKS